ncbi:MAG: hypothetical protein OQK82_03035, partial [Candidatus Pacearchaeota archaeon]|nr:hypothetical protein [Candidatus Pacearchaeota archaeon]
MRKKSGIFDLVHKELKRDLQEKKIIFGLFCVFCVSFFVLGVFFISKLALTGYVGYVDSKGGYVTELEVTDKWGTEHWSGIYGLALRVSGFTEQLYEDFDSGTIGRMDVFFDCLDSSAIGGVEVYASTSSNVNFDNLEPASVGDIDSYIGCFGKVDCADNTFTSEMSIMLGTRNVTGIPSTFTYKYGGYNDVFDVGVMTDGNDFVYVTHISSIQDSFNPDKLVNFQMLLPIPFNTTERYYFYTDPYDTCPGGSGVGENIDSILSGYVFDVFSNPLSNVSVNVAGYSVLSDENGFYNLSFTVMEGVYNVIVSNDGYDTYFSNVSVSFSNYSIEKNVTMSVETPSVGGEIINPYVFGYVKSGSGSVLPDVEVILGNETSYTDNDGFYSLSPSLSVQGHPIVASKTNYNNYYAVLNFTTESVFVNHNITMSEASVNYGPYLTGPYSENNDNDGDYDEPPVEIIERGDDYWISTKEINKEVRENTFIEETIGIYNFKGNNLLV